MVLDDFNMCFTMKASCIRSTHRRMYDAIRRFSSGTLTRLGPQGYLSRINQAGFALTVRAGRWVKEVARKGKEWVAIPPASTIFGGL